MTRRQLPAILIGLAASAAAALTGFHYSVAADYGPTGSARSQEAAAVIGSGYYRLVKYPGAGFGGFYAQTNAGCR